MGSGAAQRRHLSALLEGAKADLDDSHLAVEPIVLGLGRIGLAPPDRWPIEPPRPCAGICASVAAEPSASGRWTQRLADLDSPSARDRANRASAISGWISGSGVRTVSEKTFQCRFASSRRPMRA